VTGAAPAGTLVAAAIFLLTYLVLGLGALPPLRLDRAGATLGGISYARFAAALAPVALGALAITSAVLVVACGRSLPATIAASGQTPPPRMDRVLFTKSVLVSLGLVVAMLLGVAPALAALAGATVLLVTRRVEPGRVYELIDWPLLVMFAGLFVVVEGVERSGIAAWLIARLSGVLGGPRGFVALTAALSNLVSNVPAVMLLGKAAAAAPDPERSRLLLAMASTLAGNLTLVGSVANLIVVSQARPRARVGFWEYARVGAPITLLTLAWGAWWLR
jgi:Na+/H+ antiporter NhaD/arsenite permease-like protein